MKLFFFLIALTACSTSSAQQVKDSCIYEKIMNELHKCFVLSQEKDSVKRKDQCYELVLNKNYNELLSYGVDTTKDKNFKRYYDLYLKRFRKNSSSNDESFVGTFVKQEKIQSGEYSIWLRASDRSEKVFIASKPIPDIELKRIKGRESTIIISYHIIQRDGTLINKVKTIVYL